MISAASALSFRLAVGIVSLEEAGMLLSIVSKEEKAVILISLMKLSEAGFPVVSRKALKDYPSLEIFWNPYKRMGALFMELAAYHSAEEISQLIEIVAKNMPQFEDEIRAYMLCFEEIIYLTDLEMQSVLRREGLNPFILIDTKPDLAARLLKNVSTRVKKDTQLRLDELNRLPEIEKLINSKTALRYKANFIKAVLKMRAAREINGPYVPLTPSEISLIPQKLAEIISRIAAFDDDELSFWLNELVVWEDLASLYYWGTGDFIERLDSFLTRPMREAIQKNAPQANQTKIERKEAESLIRLKKTLS